MVNPCLASVTLRYVTKLENRSATDTRRGGRQTHCHTGREGRKGEASPPRPRPDLAASCGLRSIRN
eukprot:5933924-Prymnesium_polylepis.1